MMHIIYCLLPRGTSFSCRMTVFTCLLFKYCSLPQTIEVKHDCSALEFTINQEMSPNSADWFTVDSTVMKFLSESPGDQSDVGESFGVAQCDSTPTVPNIRQNDSSITSSPSATTNYNSLRRFHTGDLRLRKAGGQTWEPR